MASVSTSSPPRQPWLLSPDDWGETTVFIVSDASVSAEFSDRGEPVHIVDDPDAADIKVQITGLRVEQASLVASEMSRQRDIERACAIDVSRRRLAAQ